MKTEAERESARMLGLAFRRVAGRLAGGVGRGRPDDASLVFDLGGLMAASFGTEAGHMARLVRSLSRSLVRALERRDLA